MLKKLTALFLVLTLLFSLALPAFAETSSEPSSSASETAEPSDSSSESSETSPAAAQSEQVSLPTYEEAFAQMTGMDYLVLFGGFFGSMAIAMAVYYLYLKRKRKKNVDKYRRP